MTLEVTSIDQFIGSPFVKLTWAGPDSLPASAVIEVGIFPDTEGDAVGVSDALALGDGVTLAAAVLTADELVVVVDVVVDEVFELTTCGLV